jgi:hypothetical protein
LLPFADKRSRSGWTRTAIRFPPAGCSAGRRPLVTSFRTAKGARRMHYVTHSEMSRELICDWLKLPPNRWPPDHYSLIGLDPGEADPTRIEQHVQQRHEWLLRYQLAHPEVVTVALNCLARAFDCLTDPEAKKLYDAALVAKPATTHSPWWLPTSGSAPSSTEPPETSTVAAAASDGRGFCRVQCPKCGYTGRLAVRFIGLCIQCRQCREKFIAAARAMVEFNSTP